MTGLPRWVTTEKAKEILEKLHPWLEKHPPLEVFTEWLDATVETIWPLPRIAGLYVELDRAIARLRGPLPVDRRGIRTPVLG